MNLTWFIPYTDHIMLMVITFSSAFIVTMIVLPAIIRISERKKIFDLPGERKVHTRLISRLGGIGIFTGFLTSSVIWFYHNDLGQTSLILAAFLILFIVGLADDLKGLSPLVKFAGQVLAAFIIAYAGFRIESLSGIFGVHELPVPVQYAFTIFLVAGIINAVNLIDGIDGLAGGLSFISVLTLTILLIIQNKFSFALVGISLGGALLAFLRYNYHPAKIFMGDTGSIILGFSLAILGIKVLAGMEMPIFGLNYSSSVIIVFGSLLVPVYDTLRVFAGRIIKGKSPFMPDKTHIHHLIIQCGYNHAKAAKILFMAHLILISTALLLCRYNPGMVIFILVAEAVILTELLTIRQIILSFLSRNKVRKEMTRIEAGNRLIIEHFNKII